MVRYCSTRLYTRSHSTLCWTFLSHSHTRTKPFSRFLSGNPFQNWYRSKQFGCVPYGDAASCHASSSPPIGAKFFFVLLVGQVLAELGHVMFDCESPRQGRLLALRQPVSRSQARARRRESSTPSKLACSHLNRGGR